MSDIKVKIGGDNSHFKKIMAETKEAAKIGGEAFGPMLGGLGAALSVGGFAEAIARTLENMQKLEISSKKLGIPVEELQRLQFVAEETGLEMDGLATMVRKVDTAIATGKGGSAFRKLGLSMDELKGMNTEQRIGAISDAMNKLTDRTLKDKVAQELLGRSFMESKVFFEEYRAQLEDAKKRGVVSERDVKRLAQDELTIQKVKSGTTNSFTKGLAFFLDASEAAGKMGAMPINMALRAAKGEGFSGTEQERKETLNFIYQKMVGIHDSMPSNDKGGHE